MKATIEVADRSEAHVIRNGLDDPVLRAIMIAVGALSALEPHDRQRALEFINGHWNLKSANHGGE